MPKVAIITRTKDRPLFLKRAIESIHNQTYDDYIHVVINDGGDQNEIDNIIFRLPGKIKTKTQVFHRKKSSNAPDTIFNESINRVNSQYIAIHDDDDTWHEKFLEQTVKALDNGHMGVVARTDKVTETVRGGEIIELKKERYLQDVSALSIYRQCIDNQMTPIAFLYKRVAYEELGGYDDSLPVIGDWEFALRFLLKYDVCYLDPGFSLAYYHHRPAKEAENSFSKHSHRYYFNKVANRYLREEISRGHFGPGYIMSKVRYEQAYVSKSLSRLLPNFVVKRIKSKVHRN